MAQFRGDSDMSSYLLCRVVLALVMPLALISTGVVAQESMDLPLVLLRCFCYRPGNKPARTILL